MVTPVSLGAWPTPIERAPRLAAALGLRELWVKRDDLVGLGGGGNKVRKLEYTCAEALAAGAHTLVTTGAQQSNHCRLTAAAAARLGLRCVLVLAGHQPAGLAGNLILDSLAGAEVVWAGDESPTQVAQAEAARHDGAHLIPFGGTSAVSVQGYVDCAKELVDQVPDFDRVVVAVGSGGTMAGLVRELGPERVYGVDVGAVADPHATVGALLPSPPSSLTIDRSQIGRGYAAFTEPVRDAIKLAARTEGLFLDPTYTGRALAGLIASGRGDGLTRTGRVVFLHTGGLPGLFGHPEL
ncbi:pyridoxal-phosphate dependent enzyme [Actinoplanes sp. NBRC 103695]|uniref:pyridoxal-phosphate dependent enzyme n=1 Tax=Actinoplanes sp. NBRC 103695 TaxID=3032202 RepID=UPI0024A2173A|nr:pyridoxal-phosphate dependent enzyme [Actinoplanes sp. NBRC 103695]GLY94407.1 D-cysteine desulfhydrase [Actinoplanes sp. NBRC 103695]